MPVNDPKVMTREEWLAEGQKRFGTDFMKWKFKCPSCGHVQSIEDFKPFADRGATSDSARFNCIGRYTNPERDAFGGAGSGPCNYTTGGLFNITPVKVVSGDREYWSFEFAENEKAGKA